ncbi:MAG: hypothetical protein JST00_47305 [Deltaproteobacteria bacterium]|nr:hypothetical protein [Deltaproteobacteria bacterium]
MLLPQRDWLLLRARLRRFVSLAALPVMTTLTAPAEARAEGEAGEEVARGEASASGDHDPRAAVVAMREVASSGEADRLRDRLRASTGHAWRVRWFYRHGGPNAIVRPGHAIFWRTDRFELAEDFGTSRAGDDVRFGGLLLYRKGTSQLLAVFTGTLGASKEGEALRGWIGEKLAAHPSATRFVVTDAETQAALDATSRDLPPGTHARSRAS